MPEQEQAELYMNLRDRMKENWKELTLAEKKAGKCRERGKGADKKLQWHRTPQHRHWDILPS